MVDHLEPKRLVKITSVNYNISTVKYNISNVNCLESDHHLVECEAHSPLYPCPTAPRSCALHNGTRGSSVTACPAHGTQISQSLSDHNNNLSSARSDDVIQWLYPSSAQHQRRRLLVKEVQLQPRESDLTRQIY